MSVNFFSNPKKNNTNSSGSKNDDRINETFIKKNLNSAKKNISKETNSSKTAVEIFAKNKKTINEKEALQQYNNILADERKKRKKGANSSVETNSLKERLLNFFARKRKENSKLLDINLVKEEVTTFIDWQENINFLIICIIVAVFVIGFSYTVVIFIQTQEISRNSKYVGEIADLRQKQIEAEKGVEDILAFQKKLDLAADLLENHIYWTNFLEFLEKNTLADVHYSNFSGDISGRYHFDAYTTDFSAITEQVRVFRENPYVIKASVESGNKTDTNMQNKEGKINFNLNLVVDKSIFLNKYGKKDK